MILCNKHKRIEKLPPGVPIIKWVIAVKEAGYVLGQLGAKTDSTPRVKAWSVLKKKLSVIEIQADTNKADIYEILADISKGERNSNPKEIQYSIPCISFGLTNFTKSFCVAKKWWVIRPHNSDGTRNHMSIQWSNNFKDL